MECSSVAMESVMSDVRIFKVCVVITNQEYHRRWKSEKGTWHTDNGLEIVASLAIN